MPMLTHPAFGPKVALLYVTLGSLIDVWTVVYYYAYGRSRMASDSPDANRVWFWVAGFFLTGLVLIILGLVLGPLGRSARKAELPPTDATNKEARIQQTAAANPNPMAAAQVTGAVPAAVPGTVPAAAVPPPGYTGPVVAPPQPVQPAQSMPAPANRGVFPQPT